MTDPLLWLDGDPTDGRRVRRREPGRRARRAAAARRRRRPRRRRAARPLRRGAGRRRSSPRCSSAAARSRFGVLDARRRPRAPAAAVAPASAGARQADGDVAAIYAAAREASCRSRRGGGSGTGFVVDADGTIVTNAHVVGDATTRPGAVRRRRDRAGRASRGVDRSSDLAVVKVDTTRRARCKRARARRLRRAVRTGPARGRDRLAVRALADRRRPGSSPAPAATSRRRTASRSTR